MQKVKVYVLGMSCDGCAKSLKMALEDIPGVKNALVDYEQCLTVVDFEEPANLEQIEATISELGFEVHK